MSNCGQSRWAAAALYVAFLFSFLTAAWAIPTTEDVQKFSEEAKKTRDSFFKDSFNIRMKYEYDGQLSTAQKENLKGLASKAKEQLTKIAANQQKLKQQIEDYEGQDWDQKYGVTGLWRKIAADVKVTNLQKRTMDYYAAIASDKQQRGEALKNAVGLRADIEQIKISGDKNKLQEVIGDIIKKDGNDTELILSALFLQRQIDSEGFGKSFEVFPLVQGYVTKLLAEDLQNLTKAELEKRSVFEAELVVRTIWENGTGDYKGFFENLLKNEKFQTALIYYVAAVKLAEDEPNKAVEFLIKAMEIQQRQQNSRLEVSAEKIAEQTCQLGYNLYQKDRANCEIAIKVFENYFKTVNKKNLGELEYLYSQVLDGCGEKEKGQKLLEELAANGTGIWQKEAKRELISERIQAGKFGQAADFLAEVIEPNDCNACAADGMSLLGEVVGKIEQYEIEQLLKNCKKIAGYCYDCLQDEQSRNAGVYLAELIIFTAGGDKEKLQKAEELLGKLTNPNPLSDLDMMRCNARLIMAKKDYKKAGELWTIISQFRKKETSSPKERNWQWWRAKYYEFYCWSKWPDVDKARIRHSIEVLENSLENIPALWGGRIDSLKSGL